MLLTRVSTGSVVSNTEEPVTLVNVFQDGTGIQYTYDASRDSYLSINRQNYNFSIDSKKAKEGMWFETITGVPSNLGGYPIEPNSVITSIMAMFAEPGTGNIRILSMDSDFLYDVSFDSESSAINKVIIPVEGESLSAMVSLGEFNYPSLIIETAIKINL
jgi:hypothetical protein